MTKKLDITNVPQPVFGHCSAATEYDLPIRGINKSGTPETVLRLPAVRAFIGISRSTLYLQISRGLWPPSFNISQRCVGWLSREAEAIRDARVAGRNDDEIRKLVLLLVAARTHKGK